jgi:hypothetical protein
MCHSLLKCCYFYVSAFFLLDNGCVALLRRKVEEEEEEEEEGDGGRRQQQQQCTGRCNQLVLIIETRSSKTNDKRNTQPEKRCEQARSWHRRQS